VYFFLIYPILASRTTGYSRCRRKNLRWSGKKKQSQLEKLFGKTSSS